MVFTKGESAREQTDGTGVVSVYVTAAGPSAPYTGGGGKVVEDEEVGILLKNAEKRRKEECCPAPGVQWRRSASESSFLSLLTAVSISSIFLAPVQTTFPLPKRSMTTFGSYIR